MEYFNQYWYKNYLQTDINLQKSDNQYIKYSFDVLTYDSIFSGTRHQIESKYFAGRSRFFVNGNFLRNTSTSENNNFYRFLTKFEHQFKGFWLGFFGNAEKNARKNNINNNFINTSHQYKEVEIYVGLGDSTKVFTKVGFNYRDNDSIKNNAFTRINDRKTIYINSKLIQNQKTSLSVFANFRFTNNAFTMNEQSLNSRINYQQSLIKNFINLNTVYETSSNNVARQEFVYVQTEPGLGFYTWIDYNGDGIKDFDEFEVAIFQDQAEYLRLPKPNLTFLPTQRVKLQQTIFVSFKNWATQKGFKKMISHFDNQTYLLASNEQERNFDSFQLNPFNFDENRLVSLQLNFRNTIYYNRGLNKYTTSYTYGNSKSKQQFL
ncbi:MAG: hypothetical protein HC798_04220 [Polaribacter sp.]|nr:hypothetical protein [Polaribacter sp.]